MHLTTLLTLICLQLITTSATKLYVATSDGNLTTLSFTESSNATSLTTTFVTPDCGPNPSWLMLEPTEHILYCLDRGSSSSINGSMNSFSIDPSGNLTRINRVDTPSSGVSAHIFGEEGRRGIATASYNTSAAAVLPLGSKGDLSSLIQIIHPTLSQPGPVPLRQDRSYLHQVILDPTSKYVLMPDLGGDLIHVFGFDSQTLALTEVSPLVTDPGTGPRHGAFWTSPSSGELFLFFGGELDQNVYAYKVTYKAEEEGLEWSKVFEIPALGVDRAMPNGTAPLSEVSLSTDNRFLVVSNRDISFRSSARYASGPTDTLSTFSIADNGTMSLVQLAPSGGWSPRHFSLNKAGDLIAVGHQNNNTVVIWNRDIETGLIVTGEPAAVVTPTGPVVCTIWDEE